MMLITGILGAVTGGSLILAGLIFLPVSGLMYRLSFDAIDPYTGIDEGPVLRIVAAIYFALSIFMVLFGIAQLIFGIQLARVCNKPEYFGLGLTVTNLVLAVLTGAITTMVFAIIALCMKWQDTPAYNPNYNCAQPTQSPYIAQSYDFECALSRLKQYKADGIINEETYQQKLRELADRHAHNLVCNQTQN
jgi:hypothetical protein